MDDDDANDYGGDDDDDNDALAVLAVLLVQLLLYTPLRSVSFNAVGCNQLSSERTSFTLSLSV